MNEITNACREISSKRVTGYMNVIQAGVPNLRTTKHQKAIFDITAHHCTWWFSGLLILQLRACTMGFFWKRWTKHNAVSGQNDSRSWKFNTPSLYEDAKFLCYVEQIHSQSLFSMKSLALEKALIIL